MKNFMMFEDEERFARLCESLEDVIREMEENEGKLSDFEIMQALDFLGFNLFRDDWEEFKKMETPREFGFEDSNKNRGKRLIH